MTTYFDPALDLYLSDGLDRFSTIHKTLVLQLFWNFELSKNIGFDLFFKEHLETINF